MGYSIETYVYTFQVAQNTTDQEPVLITRRETGETVSNEIDTLQAESIDIEVDAKTDAAHTSTDWDVNVKTKARGQAEWKLRTSRNYGNDALDAQFSVTPGPNLLKLTVDENNTGVVRATVVLTIRKKP